MTRSIPNPMSKLKKHGFILSPSAKIRFFSSSTTAAIPLEPHGHEQNPINPRAPMQTVPDCQFTRSVDRSLYARQKVLGKLISH